MPKLLSIGGYLMAAVLIVLGVAMIVIGIVGRRLRPGRARTGGDRRHTGYDAIAETRGGDQGGRAGRRLGAVVLGGRREGRHWKGSASALPTTCASTRLEATGGKTYAQMPRYATADGEGANDAAEAEKGPGGAPQDNAGATSG